MTIPELITQVLGMIRQQFYADRVREFKRDERALTKAICRYGHECAQRGWTLQVSFIAQEFRKLLISIRTSRTDFQYLPSYLEGAVTRHIGQRSEEIQAQSRKLPPKVHAIANSVKPVVVIEPTNEELLSVLYRDLAKTQKQRRMDRKQELTVKERQGKLW